MAKIDLKKKLKHLYSPSPKKIEIVDVPEMNFLLVDGQGDPNKSEWFQEAISALYAVSYTLKFACKQRKPSIDWTVMPPEALWWTGDSKEFDIANRDAWLWTLMIMQPEAVTQEAVAQAIEQVREKKHLPALDSLRFESFREGLSAQILYIGPYCDEGPTIQRMHEFIRESGHEARGKHHEIYLSDPRRVAPEKLKTILRQPMQ